jgi:glycosyltransferase involved in cell wall biosynthesis
MGDAVLLSVIVPTVGRPSLARTLRSLLFQRSALPYEIVLVGDTHAGTWMHQLEAIPPLLVGLPRVTYVEHDGGRHAWGHPQRNFGATAACGRYLAWLGDDDIYLPGAFDAIHANLRARAEPRVHLFRWIPPWKAPVLWEEAGVLLQDHVDAEQIVCPNDPAKLGTWNAGRYQGDYDFIRETVERWGGVERVVWRPEVIAQAQPSDEEDWTIERPVPAEAPA